MSFNTEDRMSLNTGDRMSTQHWGQDPTQHWGQEAHSTLATGSHSTLATGSHSTLGMGSHSTLGMGCSLNTEDRMPPQYWRQDPTQHWVECQSRWCHEYAESVERFVVQVLKLSVENSGAHKPICKYLRKARKQKHCFIESEMRANLCWLDLVSVLNKTRLDFPISFFSCIVANYQSEYCHSVTI